MVKDITVVSLSSGILGEQFVRHELDIGLRRLNEYGISVHFAKHALSGLDFIAAHPECRAEDLLCALRSDTDMILCAIGGDDTYRLLPYLFDNGELQNAASDKIFLGFSDTTVNHFTLNKVGMRTFYGQSFLSDVCELDKEMLPYTRRYFEELIRTGTISEVTPSDVWYSSRSDFSPACIGTPLMSHKNCGFRLLQGAPLFSGEILGGCIDTIFDMFDNGRYADSAEICGKYGLFPSVADWRGKIMLLESSEEKPTPEKYRKMIRTIKATGVFDAVNGVLIGKPDDETYFDEYEKIITEELTNRNLPVVTNINIGHAVPRCIIPFGVTATVDVNAQRISFGRR